MSVVLVGGRGGPRKNYTVTELFGGLNEIIIIHDDKEYRLRITSKNRLILTK